MDKLKMHSVNKVNKNIEKIYDIFPNCITERKNKSGGVEYAVDFDMLKQELSSVIVEGREERYQFTWPDKKKSILVANTEIDKTLRPCREESVQFDNTENLYIEGDNLEVLKLLQETYLGKLKMIYIDPPYNTGNDFVYEDDFSIDLEDYKDNSGQFDDEGNRLVKNLESNGRFHTDWLNMMYPRLKLARDLLTDDGVIFINIDDNEVENLKKCCNEIFGEKNVIAQLVWEKKKKGAFLNKNYTNMKEYILVCAKNYRCFKGLVGEINKNTETYPCIKTTNARGTRIIRKGTISKYKIRDYCISKNTRISAGNMELIFMDEAIIKNGILQNDVIIDSNWIYNQKSLDEYSKQGLIYITQDLYIRRIVNESRVKMLKDLLVRLDSNEYNKDILPKDRNLNGDGWGTNEDANNELHMIFKKQNLFEFPKPSKLVAKIIYSILDTECIVLDFFSGSSTTAHAVMQLNAEDGGHRKFIMVQIPEKIEEHKEAFKAGYKNICEIGKERIRRVGAKIKEGYGEKVTDLDIGFRVLKCDSSNMKEVYYNPSDFQESYLESLADNIKEDRSPEDLLFQVMLDLGVLLSSKIKEKVIDGKKVFSVNDGYLIACFDDDINERTVEAIAKMKPYYAVFRDSGYSSDSVATNFEQIFNSYSPNTERRVL